MPESFNRCVSNGGKVITKKLGGGKYIHICFLNGKSYAGEVKVVKKEVNGFAKALKKIKRKK